MPPLDSPVRWIGSCQKMSKTEAAGVRLDAAELARRKQTERLGTDGIVPLVLRLSLPAMIGFFVSSLYAFVDRIFIGNYVGETGLAAMNAAIPMTTFIFAFSILIGRGTAVIYSLALGQRDYSQAKRIFNQGVFLHLLCAGLLMIVGFSFLPKILHVLGAPEVALGLAVRYMKVALYGTPFAMLAMHNHLIRAEGASTYAMISQIAGALLNVLLDWVFMGMLGMGMEGAALATVIAQAVSVVFVFRFFMGDSVVRLSIFSFRPTWNIFRRVLYNGATPFLFHFISTLTWSIQNHMIITYAPRSHHEVGAAMAAFGVVRSVHLLVITPMLGLAMGMQPLVGYNIGAGKYRRVRHIFIVSSGIAWALVMAPYLATLIFASGLMSLFGATGDAHLLGIYTLRRYIIFLPFGGLCMLFAHYFQGTGQAGRALLISFVRQVLFALPFMLILPGIFGYAGIVFAFPVGEVFSMLFCLFMMRNEFSRLKLLEADEVV